jgi:DNA/RNA-binding domain of Phe-tRNA-synthetase-like protein
MSPPPPEGGAGSAGEGRDRAGAEPLDGVGVAPAGGPSAGWCAREVEEELPGLSLLVEEVSVGRAGSLTGDSPPDIEARLRAFSSRIRGARAVALRGEPVPAAYRVFFRHIGLDPDIERTPIEAAVLERMLRGGFPTGGLLADILLIALLDTGVPVWALDADTLDGPLGIRTSREGERLGRSADGALLPAGQLVVADASTALAPLFGEVAPAHAPGGRAPRVTVFAVQVAGVPALYAEEALWSCRMALEQV